MLFLDYLRNCLVFSIFALLCEIKTEIRLSQMKKRNNVVELDLFASSDFEEAEEEREENSLQVSSASIASLFLRLSHSKFRSSFYLNKRDKEIVAAKGMATICEHARQIIARRLAPAVIPNDGKQTPMRHGTSPVFIAQHATGCCCRGCLEKWHHIPKGRALSAGEQDYIVEVLMQWIERQMPISPD